MEIAARPVVLGRRIAQLAGGVAGAATGFSDGCLKAGEDSFQLGEPLRPLLKPLSRVAGAALGGVALGAVGAVAGALLGPLGAAALLALPHHDLAKLPPAGVREARDRVVLDSDHAMGLVGGVPLRTSANDPLHVDYLATGLAGRLGMTLAPGQHSNRVDCRYERDLDADLARLREVEKADTLVTLMETQEFPRWEIPDLRAKAGEHGLESVWYPIPDTSVPSSLGDTVSLVKGILERCRQGRNVVIHCRAGMGRTGTVAACCLVALGASPAEALALVRAARPGTVDQGSQERFIGQFQEAWAGLA